MKACYICGLNNNAKFCHHNSSIFCAHNYEYLWTLYAVRHHIFILPIQGFAPLFLKENNIIFIYKKNL